jgi:hypothetical protein
MQGDRPDISCAGLKQRFAPTVMANRNRKILHTYDFILTTSYFP